MATRSYSTLRLPRVVKSLGWVSLLTDVASEMIYPLLPVLLRSIGAGAQALGLMEGVAEIRGLGWPLRAVFAVTLIPGLVAVAVVAWGVTEPAASVDTPRENTAGATPALPRKLRAYLALVALFTLGASADSFLMLRLSDLGLATAWLPIAWVSPSGRAPGARARQRQALRSSRRRRGSETSWMVDPLAELREHAYGWATHVAQRQMGAGGVSGRASSFARIREGRIVEIRVRSLIDLDDLASFCANTGSTIREAGPRAVVCADHRSAMPLSGEVADEWSRRIRQGNPAHTKTSAVLLDPANALYNLQVERVMQCAGKQVRLFPALDELTEWLGGILTDAEKATVRELFASAGS